MGAVRTHGEQFIAVASQHHVILAHGPEQHPSIGYPAEGDSRGEIRLGGG